MRRIGFPSGIFKMKKEIIEKQNIHSPWAWIPTLYFAQGLPYVAVMTISVIMYKRLGISNTELAFYTGWLNLPWVIKPLWSPFIDLIKRNAGGSSLCNS